MCFGLGNCLGIDHYKTKNNINTYLSYLYYEKHYEGLEKREILPSLEIN